MAFCTNCGAPVAGAFCGNCGRAAAPPASSGAAGGPAPVQPGSPEPVYSLPDGTAAAPKGIHPLVWVGVAFGALFLLTIAGFVFTTYFVVHKAKQAGIDSELMSKNPALAATKFLAAVNPDMEVVRVDDGQGKITVRDKKSGKVVTMDFDSFKQGKITFQEDGEKPVTVEAHANGASGTFEVNSQEGSFKMGAGTDVSRPGWVPSYPGSKPHGTFALQVKDGNSGSFQFTTADSTEKVLQFYERELKQAGFKTTLTATEKSGESAGGIVTAEETATHRSAMVTVGSEAGSTTVNVVFDQKQ